MPGINLRPTIAYVDTSAIGAIAFTEPDAADIALRLASYSVLLSAELLEAELRAACARERQSFNPGLLSRVEWILPHRSLRPEMVSALQIGYRRGADLWHIATALYISRAIPRLDFVTRDRRQRDIASGLGFVT